VSTLLANFPKCSQCVNTISSLVWSLNAKMLLAVSDGSTRCLSQKKPMGIRRVTSYTPHPAYHQWYHHRYLIDERWHVRWNRRHILISVMAARCHTTIHWIVTWHVGNGMLYVQGHHGGVSLQQRTDTRDGKLASAFNRICRCNACHGDLTSLTMNRHDRQKFSLEHAWSSESCALFESSLNPIEYHLNQ